MTPHSTIDPEVAERKVLDAADRLFYERGIAGVGMDDVRDTAGVSLRRLYALHPSKRDLVAAWLDDRHRRWMQWFIETTDRKTVEGTPPLVAAFDALAEWVASPGYRGCAFLNSMAETAEIDSTHRAIIASHKRDLVGHLATLAIREQPEAPTWLAESIGVLIDGAIVQSTVFDSAEPVAAARAAAVALVERTL